jgi:PPM family protein phosphatase
MHWEVGLAKNIGGRGEQQDHIGMSLSDDGQYGLLALADGMGGHRGGALASRLVVDTAQATWSHQHPGTWEAQSLLVDLCREAHTRIVELGQRHNLDPHTTCVLLLLDPGKASWVHVGDSRCYFIRGNQVISRTRDHSVVQLLVDLKEVAEHEMGTHPDQNKLLKSLGGGADPDPEFGTAGVREGDGFVLCSDGFWETITPVEMAKALTVNDLQAEADRLVELAAERGGDAGDNASVVLVRASASGGGGEAASVLDRLKRLVR